MQKFLLSGFTYGRGKSADPPPLLAGCEERKGGELWSLTLEGRVTSIAYFSIQILGVQYSSHFPTNIRITGWLPLSACNDKQIMLDGDEENYFGIVHFERGREERKQSTEKSFTFPLNLICSPPHFLAFIRRAWLDAKSMHRITFSLFFLL